MIETLVNQEPMQRRFQSNVNRRPVGVGGIWAVRWWILPVWCFFGWVLGDGSEGGLPFSVFEEVKCPFDSLFDCVQLVQENTLNKHLAALSHQSPDAVWRRLRFP